ncbi:uncharacterized protein LOC124936383 [Impatiens glandulifera]|uniref:uncharacterized protein LOC124936383 n=1 Tax=Impatiens glandulifera TaxID=253017 RepID=UPI001FB17BE7|nr:uncharacterized protein LOC124936383 [Impatiens glandulifera]
MEEIRTIVVVVEDVEAAKTALRWSLNNIVRHGDLITLLHVFPSSSSRSKKTKKKLRLRGFQLALSFKDICDHFPNTKIEIVVMEADRQEGDTIASVVRETGASTLVAGLHDQSFLYKLALGRNNIVKTLNCKIIAMKQPAVASDVSSVPNMDLSEIEFGLSIPEIPQPKIPYRICPDPSAIICISRLRKKPKRNGS